MQEVTTRYANQHIAPGRYKCVVMDKCEKITKVTSFKVNEKNTESTFNGKALINVS